MATPSVTMTDLQKVQMSITWMDGAGFPVPAPAGIVPTWAVDASGIVSIDTSADPSGLTAFAVAADGALGTATVTVTAPKAAADGSDLSSTGTVIVTTSGLAAVGILFNTPVSK